eukprot:TRINITY_DN836_c0_g1_i2.p2 TRINITY_DN836_c0_g1~~TRINITY_DN836_c0_g1_i2.p2  ORF type:complete len:148 (-),score=26.62 TRINITY_DN836_c0_g1_i2:249-692(-)
MSKACYDVSEAPMVFARMEAITTPVDENTNKKAEKNSADIAEFNIDEYFSTHPATKNRINKLNNLISTEIQQMNMKCPTSWLGMRISKNTFYQFDYSQKFPAATPEHLKQSLSHSGIDPTKPLFSFGFITFFNNLAQRFAKRKPLCI